MKNTNPETTMTELTNEEREAVSMLRRWIENDPEGKHAMLAVVRVIVPLIDRLTAPAPPGDELIAGLAKCHAEMTPGEWHEDPEGDGPYVIVVGDAHDPGSLDPNSIAIAIASDFDDVVGIAFLRNSLPGILARLASSAREREAVAKLVEAATAVIRDNYLFGSVENLRAALAHYKESR